MAGDSRITPGTTRIKCEWCQARSTVEQLRWNRNWPCCERPVVKGLGVQKCRICGEPVRDHDFTRMGQCREERYA